MTRDRLVANYDETENELLPSNYEEDRLYARGARNYRMYDVTNIVYDIKTYKLTIMKYV